jgi:hypothetical protein
VISLFASVCLTKRTTVVLSRSKRRTKKRRKAMWVSCNAYRCT